MTYVRKDLFERVTSGVSVFLGLVLIADALVVAGRNTSEAKCTMRSSGMQKQEK